jgi:Meckel syndrome type 1 protein
VKQSLCLGLVVAWLLAAAGGTALAQSAPAPAPAPANKDGKDAKPDAKADAKADAEAMERARRLAANPMRIILEASRVRRRDAEPAAAPIVPVVATSTAAPAAVVSQPAVEVAPRAVPVPVREAPPPPPEPAAAVISSELTQTKAATVAAPALVATPVARPVATSTPPLPALATLSAEFARPQLITRVDPEPPQRLLVDLEPNTVITAELTIRPDGSVGQVSIVSPNARALGRYVVTALQQWRFAPLPSERQWRVDLLFRPDE